MADRWTPEEDRRLCELVNECRRNQTPKMWMHISQIINRTPLSARSHWDRMVQGEAKVRAGLAKNKCERCGAFRLGHVCGEKNRSVFMSQPERLEVAPHKLARRTRAARMNDFDFVSQNNFILNSAGRIVRPLEPERPAPEPSRAQSGSSSSTRPGSSSGLENVPGLAGPAARSRPPSPSTASTQPCPEGSEAQEESQEQQRQTQLDGTAAPEASGENEPAGGSQCPAQPAPSARPARSAASQLIKPFVRKRVTRREWSAASRDIRELALRKLSQEGEALVPKDRVIERRRVIEEAGVILSAVFRREPFEHHIRSGSAISLQRKRAREEPPPAPAAEPESDASGLVSDSEESESDSN